MLGEGETRGKMREGSERLIEGRVSMHGDEVACRGGGVGRGRGRRSVCADVLKIE